MLPRAAMYESGMPSNTLVQRRILGQLADFSAQG